MSSFRFLFAAILLSATGLSADGALVVFGESKDFSDPGRYTVNLFATAVDQSEEVGGFNIDLDFSDTNFSFVSLEYNSIFETILPVSAGTKLAQLQGTDLEFVPLPIAMGDTVSLASVTFDALATGRVPISIIEINNSIFEPIGASVSPTASALSLKAVSVPEPSSLVLTSAMGCVALMMRRRLSRRKKVSRPA